MMMQLLLSRLVSSVSAPVSFRSRCLAYASSSQRLEEEVRELYHFLRTKQNVVVITGAGVSTASGIPDYRGVNGSYRKGHIPMVHTDFMSSDSSRQRYWSRSMKGFRFVAEAKPNDAHRAIHQLQLRGAIKHIITQNVDGLHTKAGSEGVLNIHGRIDEVVCMTCHQVGCRHQFQKALEGCNPSFLSPVRDKRSHSLEDVRADGDLEIDPSLDISQFQVPTCSSCSAAEEGESYPPVMKPNVVFFGDNVPPSVSQEAMQKVEASDGVLVVGTTLEVYSVFRLVRKAFRARVPLAIVNQGETRIEREASKIMADAILSAGGRRDGVVASRDDIARVERQVQEVIRVKSEADCGLLLSKLSTYYQNV